jgi:hypothetical protein
MTIRSRTGWQALRPALARAAKVQPPAFSAPEKEITVTLVTQPSNYKQFLAVMAVTVRQEN